MDLGLGNLATLKTHLLKGAMNTDQYPDLDTDIIAIGQGVAAGFEKYCARTFKRAEDIQETTNGGRNFMLVSVYPIEAVSLVELKTDEATGWLTQAGVIRMNNLKAGLLTFWSMLGLETSLIRITYTGGFWYDAVEADPSADPPVDPGEIPDGANPLPADLKLAWLLQCENIFAAHDKMGQSVSADPDAKSKIATVALVPEVKRILDAYRRISIL